MRRAALPLVLIVFALGLVATSVRGAFTIDESNYIATLRALRGGRLSLPGTDGLEPSSEYYSFDPSLASRGPPTTPVVSAAPPLYAPWALPFSFLGWYGLVALNALAFVWTVWLVYRHVGFTGGSARAAWLAAAALLLGSFSIEYAQGVWPHCLSVALCTTAVVLAARVRGGANPAWALASGALVGLASGIRYQNVVFAACVGLGLLVFAPRRIRSSALYALGCAGPLATSALLNHLRLGSWNPISKGQGYLTVLPGGGGPSAGLLSRLFAPFHVIYARLVDYRSHVTLSGYPGEFVWWRDKRLGAFVYGGTVKKALLQSAPWFAIAVLALVLCWRKSEGASDRKRQELRCLSFVFFGVLAAFGVAGFGKHDGLCFNQRYLLELVPLGAVALAWSVDDIPLERQRLLLGCALGLALAWVFVRLPGDSRLRAQGLMLAPLVLAAGIAVLWGLARRDRRHAGAFAILLTTCLAWAMTVHLGDDLRGSRMRREMNAFLSDRWSPLPDQSALMVYLRAEASAPLHLDRDLLVLETHNDDAVTAARIGAELRRRGRRVFVDLGLIPPALVPRIQGDAATKPFVDGELPIVELVDR